MSMLISTRRDALCALAGFAATAAPAFADEGWSATIDEHIRLRTHLAGRTALYFHTGEIWARREGHLAELLFNLEICSFQRLARSPEGHLEYISSDLGAFKNPRTGAYLETWTNPYNGAQCDVPLMGSGNVNRLLMTSGGETLGLGPVKGTIRPGPPVTQHGTTWVTEDSNVLIPRKMPGRDGAPATEILVSTSSLATYRARTADLEHAATAFVPVQVSAAEASGWWPWMKMDDIEGITLWRLIGSKIPGPDALPPPVRSFFEAARAGWLANPGV